MKKLIFISLTILLTGCRYYYINSGIPVDKGSSFSGTNQINYIYLTKKGTQIMPRTNPDFCKPSEDAKSLIFAPIVIPPKMSAPTEEDYNKIGFYRKAVEPPAPPEGKTLASTRYVVEDNEVVAKYEYEDIQYTIDDYDAAMEEHLLTERSERGYTTREPDAYLASSNIRWRTDAEDWVAHRDSVMEYALQIMNEVQQGLRPPPTMEEFKSGLPKIEWTVE